MNHNILYSIIASPLHKDYSRIYSSMNIRSYFFSSVRKAIQFLKKEKPDYIVADFIYGYGSNYAGVNVSNLDVFLHSLQKEAPDAKVIIFAEKTELTFVEKLTELFDIHQVFTYPVLADELRNALER